MPSNDIFYIHMYWRQLELLYLSLAVSLALRSLLSLTHRSLALSRALSPALSPALLPLSALLSAPLYSHAAEQWELKMLELKMKWWPCTLAFASFLCMFYSINVQPFVCCTKEIFGFRFEEHCMHRMSRMAKPSCTLATLYEMRFLFLWLYIKRSTPSQMYCKVFCESEREKPLVSLWWMLTKFNV